MKKFVNKWGEPTPSKPDSSSIILNNTGWDNMKGGSNKKEENKKKYLKMKEKYLKLKNSQLKKLN